MEKYVPTYSENQIKSGILTCPKANKGHPIQDFEQQRFNLLEIQDNLISTSRLIDILVLVHGWYCSTRTPNSVRGRS